MPSSPVLSDSFADSPISTRGPRWSRMTRYWPTLLWNTGTSDPSGFNVNPDHAELHDKYVASGVAAARTYPDHLPGGRQLASFTHRPDSRENGSAAATFKLVDVVGGQQDFWGSNFWAGVGARITGETGTEFDAQAGHTEALIAPSGYVFWLLSRSSGGSPSGGAAVLKFALHKITGPGTAGGVSTVQELDSLVWSVATPDELYANATFRLRLSAVTNAGVTELRCYYTDPDGDETEVISYDEGTGALAEPGHMMVCTTTEMTDPTLNSDHGFVMGVVEFEIRDGDDDLVMRDQFDRVQQVTARQAGPDAFWTSGSEDYGHLVTGMFTGDQGSEDVTGELPDFGDRVGRHASIAKLAFVSGDLSGHHLFHQTPSNVYSQAVQIQVDFAAGGSGLNRIAGVGVRRSLGENSNYQNITDNTETSGYTVAVHYASGVWALRVHRSIGSEWEVVAYRILNESGDPTTFALGTAWTMRVDVENRDGANTATGNVHLDILMNGERLTGWTILTTGIVEEDDGSLTDTTSDRVLSGGATGFYAANAEPGSGGEVFVLNAQQIEVALDLTETEQRSVYVPAEKDGVTGTLTVPHEWPVETTYEDYAVAHDLDSEHVNRHSAASAQRRRWSISSRAATQTEVDALRAFFLARRGAEVPFNWTTPDEEAVIVAMEPHSLSIKKLGKSAYEFGVVLAEMVGEDPQGGATANFLNSNQPYSAGGIEITDGPVGTTGPFSPVFHFEDSYGQFTVTIALDNSARGGEIVVVDFEGDAVEGTHYTNDGDPGTSRIVLEAVEGDTELTFTLTTLATGTWHAERRLEIVINQTETLIAVDPIDNFLYVYLRSTTAPPEVEFAAASQSAARGTTASVVVNKISGSAHEDNLRLYFEVDETQADSAIEGDDYEWLIGPGDPYGLYTISPVTMGRTVFVKIKSGANTSRKVYLNLRHEPSDRSERNFWTRTDSLEYQQTENTARIVPGTPSDNAPGPGNVLPPNPVDSWISDDQLDPWGRQTVTILKLRDVATGAGYHRKDFSGQVQCGAPHDGEGGGMISMPRFVRYSMYVMSARPNGVELPFPRFIRLGIRDRGFSLDPPQAPNVTGLGENNYSVIFDSQAATGSAVDDDGHQWDAYNTLNWPTSGEWGVEIETLRFIDGTKRDVARIWILYHEEDVNRLGHACVRIWYPIYFGQGAGGTGENLDNNKGKAGAFFWPQLDVSNTFITGAPPPYHPRDAFFDEPLGNAVALTGGNVQHQISIT